MSYSTEKLAGEPIILHTMHANYKGTRDADSGISSIIVLLDVETEPVYVIHDATEARFYLDDLIYATHVGARGKNPLTRHPNVREIIVVTGSNLLMQAIRLVSCGLFNRVALRVFGNLDEALAYCRGQLSG